MTEPYEYCRVCGFDSGAYELRVNGMIAPMYAICSCCGMESGVYDDTVEQVRRYRQEWLTGKTKWAHPPTSFSWWGKAGWIEKYEAYLADIPQWWWLEHKPDNWNLEEQMKNIPEAFR